MEPQQVSPQSRIWELGLGFASTAVLHTLVKSGVIEQMRLHPRTLPELAQASELNRIIPTDSPRKIIEATLISSKGDKQ